MPTVLPQRCPQHCRHTHLGSARYLRYRCVKLSLSSDDCPAIDGVMRQFKSYVMLFSWKIYTARPLLTPTVHQNLPPTPLRYVSIEWPQTVVCLVGEMYKFMYVCRISTSVSSACCVRVACTVVSKQADP